LGAGLGGWGVSAAWIYVSAGAATLGPEALPFAALAGSLRVPNGSTVAKADTCARAGCVRVVDRRQECAGTQIVQLCCPSHHI
jgi:hypothetical protein